MLKVDTNRDSNPNNVNSDNFNVTMEGYLKRAFKIAKMTDDEQRKVMQGLAWAKSEMTMEDARKEYYNN